MRNFLITIFLLITAVNLFAQKSVSVIDYDISDFPTARARAFVYDDRNEPDLNYTKDDFELYDNGVQYDVLTFDCSNQAIVKEQSFVITFDLGLSNYDENGQTKFRRSKEIVQEMIKLINLGESDCAITSFDQQSILNYDFTVDQNELLASLNYWSPSLISNLEKGIISNPIGGLHIAAEGKNKRSLIVITDDNLIVDKNKIIETALFNETAVYFLIIGNKVSNEIKDICEQTKGFWLDQVPLTRDPINVAKDILSLAYGYIPCELVWEGRITCDEEHLVNVKIPNEFIEDDFVYNLPDELKPRIESDPEFLAFSSVVPDGRHKDLDISIYARNGDIEVTRTYIDDPRFQIINEILPANPKTIKKNGSHEMTVRYTPAIGDSNIVFTKLIVESNSCYGNEILITAGFPNKAPIKRTIEIINPKCDDVLLIDDIVSVEWTGLLPKDVVQLEYTVDAGQTWDTLVSNVINLQYDWLVPDEPTDQCLIRLIQLWPNNVGRTIDLRHKGSVNSAFFNTDGTLVVSSCSDSTAKIWNSNTGDLVHTLIGHTQPVLYADFNKNNDRVITASKDSLAILWDIQTGLEIRRFAGHTNQVRSARFSADGKYIITASFDKTVKIWDVSNGDIVKDINPSNQIVWFATFDPTGNYFATADNSGIVRMWDFDTEEVHKEFDIRFDSDYGNAIYTDFSPTGDKLVAVSLNEKKASLWDVATADTIFCVTHNDDSLSNVTINSASFLYHPTLGQLLLTAGVDNARIWSAENGELLSSPLSEHTNSVQTVVFNFDASRVLTASWDSTAKIWNVDDEGRALQIDSTNCFMTIARASLDGGEIIFPELVVGNSMDSLIVNFITNPNDFPFDIREISIIGPESDEFMIVSGNAPYEIAGNEGKSIEIKFSPKQLGERIAELKIIIPGTEYRILVKGYGIEPDLSKNSNILDFGKVDIGDFKDLTFSSIVKNVISTNIQIDSLELNGPDVDHFLILNAVEPFNLSPGSDYPLSMRFIPEFVGRRNAQLFVYNNGNVDPTVLSVIGEGWVQPRDSILISIDNVKGAPGEIIDIPVRMTTPNGKTIQSEIQGFTAFIHFNSTLLEPLDNYLSSEISGTERIIEIYLPFNQSTKIDQISDQFELAKLKFKVGLGNSISSKLSLSDISSDTDGKMIISGQDGLFELSEYCSDGDIRLIDTEGKFDLEQNFPNPFDRSTTIEFEVIENGNTRIEIINSLGHILDVPVDETLLPGRYSVQFLSQNYPSGVYFYKLITPTRTKTMMMEINK